jgi:hypothetical protein
MQHKWLALGRLPPTGEFHMVFVKLRRWKRCGLGATNPRHLRFMSNKLPINHGFVEEIGICW